MSAGKEDRLKIAERLEAELNDLERVISVLFSKYDSGAEWPRSRFMIGDRHKKLRKELTKYRDETRKQRDGVRRFYELVGVNLDNAGIVLKIAARNTKDLSAALEELAREVGVVQVPVPISKEPVATPPAPKPEEKREYQPPLAAEPPKPLPIGVQVAWATRNDRHGEDNVMEIANESGELRGIVVCDGVTNANGGLAAVSIAKSVQSGFRGFRTSENLGVLRSQLDLLVQEATRRLGNEANSKGVVQTATTLLIAFADKRGFYVYYIGDGTVRQYSEDAYSVGDYLLTYERGGALGGYISSAGIMSRPTFLFIDSQVTQGSFLVLATDGAELANPQNHLTFGTMLRDDCASGRKPLREVLETYLDGIRDRIDDATIGVVWNRLPASDLPGSVGKE